MREGERTKDTRGVGGGQRIHGERTKDTRGEGEVGVREGERTKDTYTYKRMIIVGEILGEYRRQETFRKQTKIYSYLQKPGC